VSDPVLDRDTLNDCLSLVAEEAKRYLENVDTALVRPPKVPGDGDSLGGGLPEEGAGSLAALHELVDAAEAGATRSAGPRFFHFVMGGGTPAALGADWLTSTLDQSAFNWVSSPMALRLEQVSVQWLKELFGLPAAWSGVLTTGRRWRTSLGLRPRVVGGGCDTESTSKRKGSPVCRRSRSSRAATSTRAWSKRWPCSASAVAESRPSPLTRLELWM
jgi:hypothetical protein